MSHPSTVLRLARLVKPHPRLQFGSRLRMFSSFWSRPDHYKTLGLKKGCDQKEIREAYVKLSKKHHPDLGGKAAKFAALREAYEVLSNETSRRSYDCEKETEIHGKRAQDEENELSRYGAPQPPPPHGTHEGYYGVKGVRRVSNQMIALLCIAVVAISSWSQLVAVTAVSKLRDDEWKRLTAIRQRELEESREELSHLSAQEKVERFKTRYEEGRRRRAASM